MNNTNALGVLCLATLMSLPASVQADTCLTIENLKGKAAYSHDGYKMGNDGYSDTLTFCYDGDTGKFGNNDGIFHRFGSNTWIWANATEATEVAEVWTFDLVNRKALFARTRGASLLLPSTVGAFVGDITATINW